MTHRNAIVSTTCMAAGAFACTFDTASASLTYIEAGGQVVGEAEIFSDRTTNLNQQTWVIKPTENSGTTAGDGGPIIANARGGAYVQSLPDFVGGSTPTADPTITYHMSITTTGTYQLYTRWEGNTANAGASDSLFADIVELKDGAGGTIADWYEMTQPVNGDFASPAWDAGGGFEQNQASASNNPMTWEITSPGIYTLRYSVREDGSAIDAWVFQLASLNAPTGDGPAISQIQTVIPSPTAALAGVIGLAGLGMRRRRSN